MNTYDTVSEAINGLLARGFDLDFKVFEKGFLFQNDKFDNGDFEIIEIYRFEGVRILLTKRLFTPFNRYKVIKESWLMVMAFRLNN